VLCKFRQEYRLRKNQKVDPKKEWAYIRFFGRCQKEQPPFSKDQILKAWEEERSRKVEEAERILKNAT
jgi:hypothetical protein